MCIPGYTQIGKPSKMRQGGCVEYVFLAIETVYYRFESYIRLGNFVLALKPMF